MSMAFKEGIKIPPPALNEIILAANQDVRQVCTISLKLIHFTKCLYVFSSNLSLKTKRFLNYDFIKENAVHESKEEII